ncbi:hypothetical protein HW115_13385 [Verrucomicrobiaceae bacterium N1E253]|uniref:Uncharacterized protein n=1 Tax=Oceaniferula marina TaxID=2748318 RepID=A0A851GHD3_9BACT|nr:hypothetical protein [Oceaniferula marina]NWK56609.1 hypothetical protein [Oceaniferula marina]
MSENEDNKPKTITGDSAPMTKTSAVPIRKETVRVTLKAPPQGAKGPTAPPAPLTPPTGAVPTSPKPPAPAPTIPLKTSGPATAVPPAPAPTVKLQTGGATGPATKLATPAPTVRLNTPGGSGPGTVPLTGGPATGAASQQLPKATVQLTQTQPMDAPATPSQAATIRTADDDDASSEEGEGAAAALSVVSLVAALIVLGVQLATASIWVDGEWGRLFE